MTILGIDEVGRGPWAGPLVIGACILPPRELANGSPDSEQSWQDQLTDSKKLTKKRREELEPIILKKATTGLGWVHASEIDEIGLSDSLKLATRRAVQNLKQSIGISAQNSQPSISKSVQKPNLPTAFTEIIIDGTVNFLAGTPLENYVTTLKKADLLIKEVSAASIIAKVARDRYMVELAKKYPGYGLEKHVGYGTAAHRAALLDLGPCPEHRHSFRPVAQASAVMGSGLRKRISEAAFDRRPQRGSARISAEKSVATDFSDAVREASLAYSRPSTTSLGHRAESLVADHLTSRGHTLIAKNHKTKYYEIDLITTKDHYIYFTEVKYRKSATHGSPLANITKSKRQQMTFAAESFLKYVKGQKLPYADYQPLLAVASVSGPDFHLDDWFTIRH